MALRIFSAACPLAGLLACCQVFQHDYELVAAQPCDAVVAAHQARNRIATWVSN
jgi:hypothetical protein